MSKRSRVAGVLVTTGVAVVLAALPAEATPPVGVSNQALLPGRVTDAFHVNTRLPDGTKLNLKTNDPIVVNVDNITVAAGGSTGWHTHKTFSITTVTSGTVTAYEWDGATCTTRTLTAGQAMVEGPVTHDIRNAGPTAATFTVTQLVPDGIPRRIDEPAPNGCPLPK